LTSTVFFTRRNFLAAFCSSMPGRLQQEHEGRGRAVHDRQFGGIDIDVDVVDAQAGQGRHQVLDGGDLDAVLFQAGGQARIADAEGSALRSTGGFRSTRRNTTPVSGCAGRRTSVTLTPEWSPTPVALTTDFRVR
jgi:hypothetical protein